MATSKKAEVAKQQGGWVGRDEADLPKYPPAGTVPDYEQHFGPDDVPAEVPRLHYVVLLILNTIYLLVLRIKCSLSHLTCTLPLQRRQASLGLVSLQDGH